MVPAEHPQGLLGLGACLVKAGSKENKIGFVFQGSTFKFHLTQLSCAVAFLMSHARNATSGAGADESWTRRLIRKEVHFFREEEMSP